ncbi:hypothetical protein SVIO_071380 [Streptomyces violaceusniger]|uniref:Uncharacterized protein n=1 Tax=Streptomyces violaceusniger TaxID=68280 RepID=A0A4D4L614_STRVO|nr:hypothetical protein SVIO_071380 [Streptomyces violaceusniger]
MPLSRAVPRVIMSPPRVTGRRCPAGTAVRLCTTGIARYPILTWPAARTGPSDGKMPQSHEIATPTNVFPKSRPLTLPEEPA